MEAGKRCTAFCQFFRCGQKALQRRGDKLYCRLGDDLCEGYSCKYVLCVRNRLLNNGICGLTVKKVSSSVETLPEEEMDMPVKIRGKLQHRIREVELY